jgi:hypothetical protein
VTNVYPNNKNKNNKDKSKPLELYELAGKKGLTKGCLLLDSPMADCVRNDWNVQGSIKFFAPSSLLAAEDKFSMKTWPNEELGVI